MVLPSCLFSVSDACALSLPSALLSLNSLRRCLRELCTFHVCSITVPDGIRAKDLDVQIHAATLKVAMRDGSKSYIDGQTCGPISVDASTWCKDGTEIELTLTKGPGSEKWWKAVVEGATEVDVQGIEGSQYVDDSLQKRIYEEKQRKAAEEAAAAAAAADGETKEETE
jgi:CS domain